MAILEGEDRHLDHAAVQDRFVAARSEALQRGEAVPAGAQNKAVLRPEDPRA
jgi:hypothetical protein